VAQGKTSSSEQVLLRWSDYVPSSDVQDPLGLALRGSARLGSSLLYCITSITPRARYFAFLPWAILDHQRRERDRAHALALHDAIVLREQALTLGCIAHHDGHPCAGGALVGTRGAQRWYAVNRETVNLRKVRFAKNPALSAYFNSLVNLGFFVTETEAIETEEIRDEEELTFDDIELSELGIRLAEAYDSSVSRLAATRELASTRRVCTINHLAEFGKRGGLCELLRNDAADRDLLQQIFFNQLSDKGPSHQVRRLSLLLILELCRVLGRKGVSLDEPAFGDAVYFGILRDSATQRALTLPPQLRDIATRWRMFYFHHYMSVALEGMFAWSIAQLEPQGLTGATVAELVDRLDDRSLGRELPQIFGLALTGKFALTSPAEFFGAFDIDSRELDERVSLALDRAVTPNTLVAENAQEHLIRSNAYLTSPIGLAVPLVLLALTLGRYRRWETSNFGRWLANHVSDPYLDLLPPLVSLGLSQRFGNWWSSSWRDLASHVLTRFVIRQHLTMSYEKSSTGDRCLIQDDG